MNRIKELRKSLNLTQTELSKKLNVHYTAVSQWETGRTNPDTAQLIQLAKFFEVSIDYIIGNNITSEEKIPSTKAEDISNEEILKLAGKLSKENLKKFMDYGYLLNKASNHKDG